MKLVSGINNDAEIFPLASKSNDICQSSGNPPQLDLKSMVLSELSVGAE
jgi:hypothetical protein